MQKTNIKKILSLLFCFVLFVAIALFVTGCDDKKDEPTVEKTFTFIAVSKDGEESSFQIKSDKKTVGEALLQEGLIDGEDSKYGLFIKSVNGEVLDFDADGLYWGLYVNGEYSNYGVDSVEIVDGATYTLRPTK